MPILTDYKRKRDIQQNMSVPKSMHLYGVSLFFKKYHYFGAHENKASAVFSRGNSHCLLWFLLISIVSFLNKKKFVQAIRKVLI